MSYHNLLLRLLPIFVLATSINANSVVTADRSFVVDYERDTFLMDGQPFRYVAGSFHYFRALPETWQRKLRTMRAAGLNAVTTYVEWSIHNPKEGVYVWDGMADLERFIELAKQEDLYVILRPGPYICAERDMGGFPYWLLRKNPEVKLRTDDPDYQREVIIWFDLLLSKMTRHLYGNGGNIIMVQIENEYGSFYACDLKYREWLRDLTHSYVMDKAVLFTTDGPSLVKCGRVDGVFTTIDFGAGGDPNQHWKYLHEYQPKGPLVNSEYYPGWLTHWQEPMQRRDVEPIVETLVKMLDQGANVNFYMFFGGTNFGFTAGANGGGEGGYNSDVTSYDYDAPMTESGDITPKYMRLRETIGRYLPLPNISIPEPTPKANYGTVKLTACCNLLVGGKKYLSAGESQAEKPLTFEALDQNSGFVLYETPLPTLNKDPSLLQIDRIRDRAYVFIDRNLIGVLSRESMSFQLPILPQSGTTLQILVENQGRINYGTPNDFKGILSDVLLDKKILKNWNMTKYPLDNYEQIEEFIAKQKSYRYGIRRNLNDKSMLQNGPLVFHGEFLIENEPADTYLDPTGWGKGVAFVNGFNLGRYWPVVGPQINLYVPKDILKTGSNRVVLIEYQKAPGSGDIIFTDVPSLDGYQNTRRRV